MEGFAVAILKVFTPSSAQLEAKIELKEIPMIVMTGSANPLFEFLWKPIIWIVGLMYPGETKYPKVNTNGSSDDICVFPLNTMTLLTKEGSLIAGVEHVTEDDDNFLACT